MTISVWQLRVFPTVQGVHSAQAAPVVCTLLLPGCCRGDRGKLEWCTSLFFNVKLMTPCRLFEMCTLLLLVLYDVVDDILCPSSQQILPHIVFMTVYLAKGSDYTKTGSTFLINIISCGNVAQQTGDGNRMLCHPLRRWPNIKQTLGQHLVFAGGI